VKDIAKEADVSISAGLSPSVMKIENARGKTLLRWINAE